MKLKESVSYGVSISKPGKPSIIFWILIFVCATSCLFALINRSSEGYLLQTKIPGVSIGMIYFTVWLMAGITVAFITGALSFIDYFVKRSLSTTVIGSASLAIGSYEVFYFFVGLDEPSSPTDIYSRWFISRSLHLLLVFGTTLYFSYSQLKAIRNPNNRRSRLVSFHILSILALLLAVSATFIYEDKSFWNVNIFGLKHPFEIVLIIFYLYFAFVTLPVFLKRFPSSFAHLLRLSVIPAISSSLLIAFNDQPFDAFFNTAYFLRISQYLMPLLGIGLNYIESSSRERYTVMQLRNQISERIRTQQKLQQREALLASAEKIAHLGSWHYHPETEELEWSDEMFSIFGEKVNAFKPESRQWKEWVLEPYWDIVQDKMMGAVQTKGSYTVEFQIRRANGEIRHILAQGNYSDEDNRLLNIMLDLTDIKEAAYKVEQSEALLREAESLSHNGSWEWNQEKNVFFWSDEMYRIHGLNPQEEEIDLRFYLNLIHPDDVEHFVTILADTQFHLSAFSINYRIVRPDGEVRHLSLNGKFKTDFSGNVLNILGNTQDITELKLASEKLEQSESIYKTIVRNVPDSAIFLFDKDLKLILSGGPALSIIDPGNNISNAHNFHYLFFKNKDSQPLLYFNMAFDGQENRVEHRIGNKVFKIIFTPVYLSGGSVMGVMVVMNDITDLKHAQQSLEGKINELNRSNSDLEQFAYIASHDLQEPLRKIRAFGERLNIRYRDYLQDEGVDYLNRMNSASERMQLLINDLLTFSRISKIEEQLKPVSLSESIKQVTHDLEFSFEKQRATLNIDCPDNVKVAPSLLRHLLQNLFSNSLKFARKEEPLIIEVRSEIVAGSSHIALDGNKKYCKIEVVDNGIGFENQFSEKIFILFHRLHSRQEYEGTGIGLAICKKIVENHNGIIEAEGLENKGSVFRIFLPAD